MPTFTSECSPGIGRFADRIDPAMVAAFIRRFVAP
jgi:hypothetical protein